MEASVVHYNKVQQKEGLSKGLTVLASKSAATRGDYVSVCLDA